MYPFMHCLSVLPVCLSVFSLSLFYLPTYLPIICLYNWSILPSLSIYLTYLPTYLHLPIYLAHMHLGTDMEVKGHFVGIGSLFWLYGSWGSNSGCQSDLVAETLPHSAISLALDQFLRLHISSVYACNPRIWEVQIWRSLLSSRQAGG